MLYFSLGDFNFQTTFDTILKIEDDNGTLVDM